MAMGSDSRDNFSHITGDIVEPSSSPSEGSLSPLRTLTDDTVAGLAGTPASTSHAAGRNPVFNKHDGPHHFRKGHRSHTQDSSTSSPKKLSSLLVLTSERLDKETRRANDAERRALEAIALARSANEAKLIAQRDATRANEELRLYKLQYDNAQREIYKAQELIDHIEAERQEAEAAAARARSTARKLKEQNVIIRAREEGRLLGYQEGLANGRMMAYEESTRAGDYTEESDSGDEVMLPELPSNIRLRSPTPGTGSRPSSRPPTLKQPTPMRPPSRSARADFESAPHPPALATPIKPILAGPPPPPIHLEATPSPENCARSKSNPLGYPPENGIPVAGKGLHIANPSLYHMSPSPGFVIPERRAHTPVPPPPIIPENIPEETSTMSETSSQTTPKRPVVSPNDYVYQPLGLRKQRPTPLSHSSMGPSDIGTSGSPNTARFEIVRSSTPVGVNRRRAWSLKTGKQSVSPAPILPLVTESMIATQNRGPGKSRLSSSSSPSPPTTTAKHSSSSTPSTERTKLDPRKDSNSVGDSFSRLFRKRAQQLSAEGGSTGSESGSMYILVQSPSESGGSIDRGSPENPPEPLLLTPIYRPVVMNGEPSTSTPKRTGGNQNLPPLSEFTNLISPGQEGVSTPDLPPGFVPNRPLTNQVQQGDGGGGQPSRRSASTRWEGQQYEAAPLMPGVHYPTPPPRTDFPRPRSRGSQSSMQGQVPGSLSTP